MRKNKFLGLSAVAIAAAGMPACKMPPQQAWRQIQSEGLIAYMGAEPMQRQVAAESQMTRSQKLKSDSWSNFVWMDSGRTTATNQPNRSSAPTQRRSLGAGPALLTATPVAGQPGYVYSPHAKGKLVNVKRFKAGQEVRCPHTDRSFLVPDFEKMPRLATNSASRSNPTRRSTSKPNSSRRRMSFETTDTKPAPRYAGAPRELESDLDPAPTSPAEPTAPVFKPDGMTATRVPGNTSQVYSPYAGKNQIVDISGMVPGEKARCPYTNRVFVVPGLSVGAAEATPTSKPTVAQTQAKKEMAKISDELNFRVLEPEANKKEMGAAADTAKPSPKVEAKPVEKAEQAPAPQPKAEAKKEAPAEKKADTASVPTASWSDKAGFVSSPFGGHSVDVSGKAAGSVVRCPFSGKSFKVPGGSN